MCQPGGTCSGCSSSSASCCWPSRRTISRSASCSPRRSTPPDSAGTDSVHCCSGSSSASGCCKLSTPSAVTTLPRTWARRPGALRGRPPAASGRRWPCPASSAGYLLLALTFAVPNVTGHAGRGGLRRPVHLADVAGYQAGGVPAVHRRRGASLLRYRRHHVRIPGSSGRCPGQGGARPPPLAQVSTGAGHRCCAIWLVVVFDIRGWCRPSRTPRSGISSRRPLP